MKNLYKLLKVRRGVPVRKIRDAIERCQNATTKMDAKRVLLDPQSRAVYDRNHELLTTISKLRSKMGLNNSHNWSEELRREFTTKRAPVGWVVFALIGLSIGFLVFWESAYWQFEQTKKRDVIAAYEKFLNDHPQSKYSHEATERLWFLTSLKEWERLEPLIEKHAESLTPQISAQAQLASGLYNFVEDFDGSERADEAAELLEDMRKRLLEEVNSVADAIYLARIFPEHDVAKHLVTLADQWTRGTDDLSKLKEITSLLQSDAMDELNQSGLIGIRSRVRTKVEQMSLNIALKEGTKEPLIEFLAEYPESDKRTQIERQIDEISYEEALDEGTEEALEKFISEDRPYDLRANARTKLTALKEQYGYWAFVRNLDTADGYKRYLDLRPDGHYADTARKRLIDLEVDDILEGDVGQLPDLQPLQFSNRNRTSAVEVKNDTSYILTVRYSGPDSQKHVIQPGREVTFSIGKGTYRVTASVDARRVIPYAGSEEISYDRYGSSFYISTIGF